MKKKRGCGFRLFQLFLLLLLLLCVGVYFLFVFPFWGYPFHSGKDLKVPLTPAWALEPWLWEDDGNTSETILSLLRDYEAQDFPVRTILIDSPWSLRYNDFTVDEKAYPKPAEFFGDLDKRGYRVVLWMTPMVNSESKEGKIAVTDSREWYEKARDDGYLAGGGSQVGWWMGRGGFIDYTNPAAMKWWRGMQNQVFEWGLDGWKLDDTATQFGFISRSLRFPLPVPYLNVHSGPMTTRQYMDYYYREEYKHGLTKNPDFITMSRSTDRFGLLDGKKRSEFVQWLDTIAHPEGFSPLDSSPVNWVGDQDHAWSLEHEGIEEALTDILRSASMGYNVIGSDIPGYSGKDIPPNLYARWSQFSAFCGLFLNGGHGDRRLWLTNQREWEIVRRFAWLHSELVPYIYTHVAACSEGGKPLMRPLEPKYHYFFGDDFLVAPIYEDNLMRSVTFPAGKWRYMFNDLEVIEGPTTTRRTFPLEEAPVYIRDGAIIPLNVSRAYTGYGDENSKGYVTWLVYPSKNTEFEMVHPDKSGRTKLESRMSTSLTLQLSGVHKPHILRIHMIFPPLKVQRDMKTLEENVDWTYDRERAKLIIRTDEYEDGKYTVEY